MPAGRTRPRRAEPAPAVPLRPLDGSNLWPRGAGCQFGAGAAVPARGGAARTRSIASPARRAVASTVAVTSLSAVSCGLWMECRRDWKLIAGTPAWTNVWWSEIRLRLVISQPSAAAATPAA